jgi:hypothetical protein
MEKQKLASLLNAVRAGAMPVDRAIEELKDLPFFDMGFAKIDHHRGIRTGHPEVIFCQMKTPEQVVAIARRQIEHDETVFGTRANAATLESMREAVADIDISVAGGCFWRKSPSWKPDPAARGDIVIVSAGTADNPVAEEARCTAAIMGHPHECIQDVGVSGIHRLFAYRDRLREAAVIIVIAGMEGALPSVVAGLVDKPVIGVPTSVGYGAHLDGLTPLFAMINSCAAGLTVVNIDNGFGAAMAAVRMNR